jgi:multiple sugar transport system ATP-binding protein
VGYFLSPCRAGPALQTLRDGSDPLQQPLDRRPAATHTKAVARVVIEHLSKVFQGPRGEQIRAVDDLNLRVNEKEFLVLVGPSGCGKTTTLRLIAGLEAPDSGTISIDGQVVNRLAPRERDLAMVFQSPALYPHMSARHNMGFGLKLRKLPCAEIEQRVAEAAQMLGLDGCLERMPHELSGGQRQRIALGRALVRRPKLFLLDEPLSNLDAPMRLQMRAEISRLHARLCSTMIYVTHDQLEAMALGDRIAVIKDGVIQQVGPPLEVYRTPSNLFVASFIGSPPMNLFHGRLVEKGDALFFEGQGRNALPTPEPFVVRLDLAPDKGAHDSVVPAEGPQSGNRHDRVVRSLRGHLDKPVVLGVRPEAITLKGEPDGARAQWTVPAVVQRVEMAGSDAFAHLASGGDSFVARVSTADAIKRNQKVSAVFDLRQAHCFDAASGRAIA